MTCDGGDFEKSFKCLTTFNMNVVLPQPDGPEIKILKFSFNLISNTI